MDAKTWLQHVAASMPASGDATKRARLLTTFADSIRADFSPALWTLENAELVGSRLDGFPTVEAIVEAIKALPRPIAGSGSASVQAGLVETWNRGFEASLHRGEAPIRNILGVSRRHGPPEHWTWILRVHRDVVREHAPDWIGLDDEAAEKDWWRERLIDMRTRHPTSRWVWARETMAQISQPDAYPRPWLVEGLSRMIDRAVIEGADTSQPIRAPAPLPQRKAPATQAREYAA